MVDDLGRSQPGNPTWIIFITIYYHFNNEKQFFFQKLEKSKNNLHFPKIEKKTKKKKSL